MVITIADYAKFLVASMAGEGLTPALTAERNRIATNLEDIDGSGTPEALCPTDVGYGLGWYIAEVSEDTLIGHRGSMWSTVAVAFYYEDTRDGLVIVLNAPNAAGIAGMVDALALLDPDSPELHGYKTRLARSRR